MKEWLRELLLTLFGWKLNFGGSNMSCYRITSRGTSFIKHDMRCPGRVSVELCVFWVTEEEHKKKHHHGHHHHPYGHHPYGEPEYCEHGQTS